MSGYRVEQDGLFTIVHGATYGDGRIHVDEGVISEVQSSPLVLFKKVFPEEYLKKVRGQVVHHPYQYTNYTKNEFNLVYNYKRLDKVLERERRARYNLGHHFYFWNPDTPKDILEMYSSVTVLGNRLCGREENARLQINNPERKLSSASFFYYPPGSSRGPHHFLDDVGGSEARFDEIIVPFGKFGEDYHQGGLSVAKRYRLSQDYHPTNHSEPEFVDYKLDRGDVLAFTVREIFHRVEMIDPDKEGHFDPETGRFLMVMYYVPQDDLKNFYKKDEKGAT